MTLAEHAKAQLNAYVHTSLAERARNAVAAGAAPTLSDLVEDALTARVDELERTNGGPFPARAAQRLPPGFLRKSCR